MVKMRAPFLSNLRAKAVGLLVVLLSLAFSPSARAKRIVYFEVLGHSEIVSDGDLGYYDPVDPKNTGQSNLRAKCVITITNTGQSEQKISVELTGQATGGLPGSSTNTYKCSGCMAAPLPLSDYPLAANQQLTVQGIFDAPNYLTKVDQDIRCSGSISASDSDAAAPGFVVANGVLVTWTQGSPAYQPIGGRQLRAQVRYVNTPFTIGGGRAF